MRIYISIPITGHDLDEQRAKAAEIAENIKAAGHIPVNPFGVPKPPAGFNEKEQYAYYMGEDIEELLLCDAAYFTRGWDKSKGCLLEHFAAKIYGLKAYYSTDIMPTTTQQDKQQ